MLFDTRYRWRRDVSALTLVVAKMIALSDTLSMVYNNNLNFLHMLVSKFL